MATLFFFPAEHFLSSLRGPRPWPLNFLNGKHGRPGLRGCVTGVNQRLISELPFAVAWAGVKACRDRKKTRF